MITFKDAYAKAKALKPNIDKCFEHENGFVFSDSKEVMCEGPSPVVILKEDGRAVMLTYFLFKIGAGKEIGEIKIN